MLLYIVRHAPAGERGDPRYPDDGLRPVTKKGRKRFRRLVRGLVEAGFQPDVVATSPLLRCVQTAEVLAKEVPGVQGIVQVDEFKPGCELDDLIAWVKQRKATQQELGGLACVGHAPDVNQWVAGLVGASEAAFSLSKGAIVALEFGDEIAVGRGTLKWLVTPKLLPE